MTDETDGLRTVDGRVAGERAKATRRRLLDVLAAMLVTRAYRDITVVELARAAHVSPAAFYQYFADVEAAIETLAEEMADVGSERLRDLVDDGSWDSDPIAAATNVAEGFLAIWADYRAILRVVDLLSAEGDQRFRVLRTRLLNGITVAFADALAARTTSGRLPPAIVPTASAAVVTAMLAHVAAHQPGLEEWGVAGEDLMTAMARVIYWTMTDASPDTEGGL